MDTNVHESYATDLKLSVIGNECSFVAIRGYFLISMDYPRNMRGYGAAPPQANWPQDARIAVQFVINYEEGAERCILHGDSGSESFLSDIQGATPIEGARYPGMESLYEYGSRAGFWRLHRIFTEKRVPVTVFGVAQAMERNPEAVAAMKEANWEIASHGYRWIDYKTVDEATERDHFQRAIELHTELTGARPSGWYLGRCSERSLKLVKEDGGFTYCSDSYADDLPYWDHTHDKALLMIPYTLDANDMRFVSPQGFSTGDQFFDYLKDSFDTLYTEGSKCPKMMSIGLHGRISGRPGRASAVARFMDYVSSKEQVWIARRIDIANHWIQSKL